tara:strand:+ start:102223 stop:102915 length:693 start_codon:yes stop_codon:yes gene_type:complete
MGPVETIALTMGVAWASGINLYAAILTLGVMSATGNIDLPPDLEILSNPMVIGAAGLMFFIEFFVDKVPGADSAWDTLQTFIRIPAGAILAAGAVGDVGAGAELAAVIAGGSLAGASHFTKAGTRLAINTSPEPVTNWTASILEDLAVIGGLWVALNHPIVFLILLGLFILLMIWLLPKIFRAIRAVYRKLRSIFGGAPPEPAAETPAGGTSIMAEDGFSLSLKDDQAKD